MALGHSPSIVTNGLVMCLDAANYKSFKGTPAINLLYNLNNTYGDTNTTGFKSSYGNEVVFIPSLGYRTVRYCDIFNDYSVSGNCCPRLFDYGGNAVSQNIIVSPSTTYTYQIIYKTTSGYTHPNFMYRYEYNGGTYVGEAGVHSDSNRTSLGDGWWFAWGQFTTGSTTNNLWLTGMWYYQYGVYDRVSVAGVSLHQGTYIIRPEHMLTPRENRGESVATGGGWADIIGNGNHGTLTNGPTYSSDNGGSIVFDGTNDYIGIPLSTSLNKTQGTMNFWVYPTRYNGSNGYFVNRDDSIPNAVDWLWIGSWSGAFYFRLGNGSDCCSNDLTFSDVSSVIPLNSWTNMCFTWVSNGTSAIYKNGTLYTSRSIGNVPSTNPSSIGRIGLGHGNNGDEYFAGRISTTSIYNKALTASEIQQNFNALRGRFGI